MLCLAHSTLHVLHTVHVAGGKRDLPSEAQHLILAKYLTIKDVRAKIF